MDVLLLEDRSTVVEFYAPKRPSSATCRFLSPSGVSLLAPAVTVDSLSRTVTAVSQSVEAQFTAATGSGSPVAGRRYWWRTSDDGGQEALVMLSEYDANIWTLESGVPSDTVRVGDTLYGARLTTTITSTATATRDLNYRVEWTVTNADGTVDVVTQLAHVVRTVYRDAVTPVDARDYLARTWPDVCGTRGYGYFRSLASRASERVWRRIRASGRFQHLLADPNDFEAAGRAALELELLDEQMVPPQIIDRSQYRRDVEERMQREIDDVISSRPYDDTDSNDVTDSEAMSRPITAIAARRV